jgi:hypothetical protein
VVFAEKMQQLTSIILTAATSHTPLDLHDLMYRFTLDSFGQIGFGVDPGCMESKAGKVPFALAFDRAQVVSCMHQKQAGACSQHGSLQGSLQTCRTPRIAAPALVLYRDVSMQALLRSH